MLGFRGMLITPAIEAGMEVPPDVENYVGTDYPHFFVFMRVQLGASMPSSTSHFTNAKIIAAIPKDEIFNVTVNDLIELGCEFGLPIP